MRGGVGVNGRRGWLLASVAAASGLVLAALGWVLSRWAIVAGDGYQQALPLHVLVARMWRWGEVPGWNPYTFSGSPLLANGIAGVWYPPNLLFAVAPPIVSNNLTVLLCFGLAGAGAYLLAHHLTGDRVASLVSAVAFGGCGFFFGHTVHQAILASACWLPWALYGVERCRARLSPGHLAIGVIAIGMAELAGQAQTFAMVVLAVVVFELLSTSRRSLRPLLTVAAMVLLGLGLAAIQLVPTVSALHGEGVRLSYDQARSYSFPLSHLPLLVFPYLFGSTAHTFPYAAAYRGLWNLDELNGYIGVGALVFVAAGLRAIRADRRAGALGILGVSGLVLASAGGWFVGHVLYLVPVYGNFRDWGRYVVFTDLAVAVLAAYGVAELRSDDARRRRIAVRRSAAVPAILVAAGLAVHVIGPVRRFEVGGTSGWAAIIVPIVAAAAATAVGWSFGHRLRGAALSAHSAPSWGPRPSASGGIARFLLVGNRTVFSTDSYPDLSDAEGLRSANGYVPLGLAPKEYASAVGAMDYEGNVPNTDALWATGSHLLDLLRVTTVLFDPQATPASPRPGGDVSFTGDEPGGLVRYEHTPALSDAFVVGAVSVSPRPAIQAAVDGMVAWDPSTRALIESSCQRCPTGPPGRAGVVSGERWTDNRFSVVVRNSAAGMLIVSQAWFPGWKATVDHRSTPVIRADGLLQGVPVPAGTHQITLTYRTPGLRSGALLTLLMAVSLLGWGVGARRRHRRSSGLSA